jgi:hypothetical protein
LKKLIFIPVFILLLWGVIKLNFMHYEILADERIAQVIEFQGALLENSEKLIDVYDYKNECWFQSINHKDDPEITYHYEFYRSERNVRIFAKYNNMSLDLAKKQAKYPVYDIYFRKGKIAEVIER